MATVVTGWRAGSFAWRPRLVGHRMQVACRGDGQNNDFVGLRDFDRDLG